MLLQGRVDSPALWWPNGYGSQPLYTVRITAENQGCLDVWERKIGLRTLTANTEELPHETLDEHMQNLEKDSRPGRNFAFEINGLQIFAQGGVGSSIDTIVEPAWLAQAEHHAIFSRFFRQDGYDPPPDAHGL